MQYKTRSRSIALRGANIRAYDLFDLLGIDDEHIPDVLDVAKKSIIGAAYLLVTLRATQGPMRSTRLAKSYTFHYPLPHRLRG